MTKVFKRRIIREKVLQVLYAYEMNNDNLQSQIDEVFADTEEDSDKQFGLSLIYKVLPNRNKFDEMIKEKVSNWEMDRIALIDKILIRMGICELLYFEDIPPKVSINEVIEISKKFSTAGSAKFINGVLDAILNDLKKSGELKKAGRGLLDETITKKTPKKSE
ncbi:MAG: N utilization substance protein B [Ignavibacterium sp.]|uniref:transcription antitermination factor NusB n=1 Tax=Ignavibacterium sp. TaxID=2651167 RepID=UPI0021DC7A80|nr:transcription antitermination factor NusB [Ignavibacterium sp.]BDQ02212.1 MAG: N utilization substance protein B [Ignavibacterium sp.]GIV45846.1 MAG: N utilization substance protein B [Ignavibacterium sp.]